MSTTSSAGGSARPASRDESATALLIQQLYSSLELSGVRGDGYLDGVELSRQGLLQLQPPQDGTLNGQQEHGQGQDGRKVRQKSVYGLDQLNEGDSKREATFRRVDRYGFFSDSHPAALHSQHHRLSTLSSASLSSFPSSSGRARRLGAASRSSALPKQSTSANGNGVASGSNAGASARKRASSNASLLPLQDVATTTLETSRISKWAAMLSVSNRDVGGNTTDWSLTPAFSQGAGNKKFRKRVYKGVPDRWRRAAWGLMVEMREKEERAKGKGKARQGSSLKELASQYRAYLLEPLVQDVQIDLDVPRTITGHVLFHTRYGQGQRALFHVLHAFAVYCQDVGGYCQGMGPVAASFLCYFEPERAYACLVRLYDSYSLRAVFEPGFPGLVEIFYVQEKLVGLLMPDVAVSLERHGVDTSAYATKWYITLFVNTVCFRTQVRLWDGYLLEGPDFLVVTAVAIIWSLRGQFLHSSANFESILSALSSYFQVENDDILLRWIYKVLKLRNVRSKMQGWREEWRGIQQGEKGMNGKVENGTGRVK